MSATMFGKILIFANLVLSLVFATMALGIYTNRIDWPGTASPLVQGEKVLGEHARLREEIRDQEKVASAALTRWLDLTKQVADLERNRPIALAWYADKINILDTGKDRAGKAEAVTALVHKDGNLLFQNGQPVPGPNPNQPLQPTSFYLAAFGKNAADIKTQVEATNKALLDAEDLTVRINGLMGKQKGLRDLLWEEETAHRNALEELEHVKPFRYNRQAEAELLSKRQQALEARVDELKKALGTGAE
jgi:hypothetical protein